MNGSSAQSDKQNWITIMERTLVQDASRRVGECIGLRGFVQTVRNQKAVQFILLRDHTGLIQIVAERSDAASTRSLVRRHSGHQVEKASQIALRREVGDLIPLEDVLHALGRRPALASANHEAAEQPPTEYTDAVADGRDLPAG